ncbi:MAG: putative DNA-binding domain-containing protein [Acetobacteraceae bacterium]|nr:putative DNA-binding domain-containing protein [Acetobacteraceae bacterium]
MPACPPRLEAFQAAFAEALLGRAPPPAALAGAFAVYRNNVLTTLGRTLEAAFPATRVRIGPARFRALAVDFARSEPPRRPQLSAYGEGFPDFIRGALDPREAEMAAPLARLEWLRQECYFAADTAPLDGSGLRDVAAREYPRLRLAPHPASRRADFAADILALWQDCHGGRPERADTRPRAQHVLIRRAGEAVVMGEIAPDEAAFFDALARGAPVWRAVGPALARDPAFDLARVLGRHLGLSTFCGFHLDEEAPGDAELA